MGPTTRQLECFLPTAARAYELQTNELNETDGAASWITTLRATSLDRRLAWHGTNRHGYEHPHILLVIAPFLRQPHKYLTQDCRAVTTRQKERPPSTEGLDEPTLIIPTTTINHFFNLNSTCSWSHLTIRAKLSLPNRRRFKYYRGAKVKCKVGGDHPTQQI